MDSRLLPSTCYRHPRFLAVNRHEVREAGDPLSNGSGGIIHIRPQIVPLSTAARNMAARTASLLL